MKRVRMPIEHTVTLSFALRADGYRVTFTKDDGRTQLPCTLTFTTPEKIFEMLIRWGEDRSSEAVHRLERSIRLRSPGSIRLRLSEEQYRKLL